VLGEHGLSAVLAANADEPLPGYSGIHRRVEAINPGRSYNSTRPIVPGRLERWSIVNPFAVRYIFA
jgi:hypothetical protein